MSIAFLILYNHKKVESHLTSVVVHDFETFSTNRAISFCVSFYR